MSIKLTCFECDAGLRVPDTIAGKKFKCPKCGAINKAPSADEGLSSEVEVSTHSRASATHEEAGETPPSRRKDKTRKVATSRKKGQGSSNTGLWIGLGVGGVALVVIAIVVIVMFSTSELPNDVSGVAPKTPSDKGHSQSGFQEPQTIPDDQPPPVVKKGEQGRPPGPLERTNSLNNLAQIGLALHQFELTLRHLPPPTIGKGKLSWRVAILPYIEQQNFYDLFKLDEPWDSPHNLNVLNSHDMPRVFEPGRTGETDPRKTFLRMFVGPGTCYPAADSKMNLAAITDGPSNTWLIAEGKTPVEWTRPDELEVKNGQLPPLGGVYGVGFYVLCADGKAHFVAQNQFPATAIQSLINPSDGQHVPGWPPN